MMEEVKELLGRLDFNAAAIVDDAYDQSPTPEDLRGAPWDRFFDDITELEEGRLRDLYGAARYDVARTTAELARDPLFVSTVWMHRGELGPSAEALFAGFLQGQSQKLEKLFKLDQLLTNDLNLPTRKMGRAADDELEKVQIIFLDLFLGPDNEPGAVERSIERVKRVVEKRRASPPIVFLMSESPHLSELAVKVRDNAELLGCQFRAVKKSELGDKAATLELMYDLIAAYPDSQRINGFILAWDTALTESRIRFLREIRTMDLADYANMQGLILEAEEQELGDYVVDLYDLYLHNIIEGHEQLIRTAKELNGIDWKVYPPAQFMPSDIVLDMMDGTLFHNEKRTELEAEIDGDPSKIRFGDVFLADAVPAKSPTAPPSAVGAQSDAAATAASGMSDSDAGAQAGPLPRTAGLQRAYMVMSQPCDLAREGVDVALLLRGKALPYEWKQHQGKRPLAKTPIMVSRDKKMAVDWSPLTPHTWETADIPKMLSENGVWRARRLRLAFALQLQRAFLDGTGRIGTQADLPARFDAGISVYFRKADGTAKRVLQKPAGSGDAACLVGRTKEKPLEWLILSDRAVAQIREAMAATPETDVPKHEKQKFADAAKSSAFKRALRGKLEIKRDGSIKPFKNTSFDTVEISTASKLSDGQQIGTTGSAVLIEIDVR